jgi:hypothetical protein
MKQFVISLVAAYALMVALAPSALASTVGHFPEVTSPGNQNACAVLLSTPASQPGTVKSQDVV